MAKETNEPETAEETPVEAEAETEGNESAVEEKAKSLEETGK